jgi:hypothetical protein
VFASGIAVFLVLQLVLVTGLTEYAWIIWTGFGFFGAAGFLSYTVYAEHYPVALAGRVLTAANLFLFGAAFALQWGVGAIVEAFPPDQSGGHVATAHITALGVALALQVVAFAWMVWPRRAAR